jgi:quinol monooxygenase YgiN
LIVTHLSFAVDADRSTAFDCWFPPLVARTQTHPGCLGYDHLVDPASPDRHVLLEVWASREALAGHTRTAEHAEIIQLGSTRYGMRDLVLRQWLDAGDCTITRRPRTTKELAVGPEVGTEAVRDGLGMLPGNRSDGPGR